MNSSSFAAIEIGKLNRQNSPCCELAERKNKFVRQMCACASLSLSFYLYLSVCDCVRSFFSFHCDNWMWIADLLFYAVGGADFFHGLTATTRRERKKPFARAHTHILQIWFPFFFEGSLFHLFQSFIIISLDMFFIFSFGEGRFCTHFLFNWLCLFEIVFGVR